MQLSGLTLIQLRALTLAQIRTAMKANIDAMTKKQLIVLDLWCADFDKDALLELVDAPQATRNKDGELERVIEVKRDALGAKLGSRIIDWAYYPTKEVNTITLQDLDAADKVTASKVIQHYVNGQLPTTSVSKSDVTPEVVK